jgi:hypothetical protein
MTALQQMRTSLSAGTAIGDDEALAIEERHAVSSVRLGAATIAIAGEERESRMTARL